MDVDNSIVRNIMIGAHGAGVTPVPIPNTEVKPSIGEDTALRESSTVPNYQRAIRKGGSLAFLYIATAFLKRSTLTLPVVGLPE